MRIFVPHASDFLTDNQPHGDGLVAFGFICELAARGHEIHVVSPRMHLTGAVPANVFLYEYAADHELADGAKISLPRYVIWMRRLYERLRVDGRFDIIHQLNPVNTGVALGLFGVRPPVVLGNYIANWTESYGAGERPAPGKAKATLRGIVQFSQQLIASRILLTTQAAKTRLALPRLFRSKIRHVHHGIAVAKFVGSGAGYAEPVNPTILFLANLIRRKGIFTLLEAFDTVRKIIPEARLVIGGTGSEEAAVRSFVAERNWGDAISLIGNVPRSDVAEVLRRATVYCLPSYGEPYGMTALEAMAAARMLVVTDANGLGELVTRTGSRQVPPRDSGALAAALIEILSLPAEIREARGLENREFARSTYDWQIIGNQLEAVYSEILSAHAS